MEERWCMQIAEQLVYMIEREAITRNIDQTVIGNVMFPGLSTAQKAYSDLILGKRKNAISVAEACRALEYLGMSFDHVVADICALNRTGSRIEPPPARAKGGPRKQREKTKFSCVKQTAGER